jgi:predicted transcriptional regulator of viral defense system
MRFIYFREALSAFKVFSHADIRKIDPLFDRRRLVEWQEKGHILKIRNGHYCFPLKEISESFLMYVSNRIYKPSYVSLESALSYYNLIPEAVYVITGISTRKTMLFETALGNFEYRKIKDALFFGYHIIHFRDFDIKIADVEKTIMDYLYLNTIEDWEALESQRLNRVVARDLIDRDKLRGYLSLYESAKMDEKIELFLDYIDAEP